MAVKRSGRRAATGLTLLGPDHGELLVEPGVLPERHEAPDEIGLELDAPEPMLHRGLGGAATETLSNFWRIRTRSRSVSRVYFQSCGSAMSGRLVAVPLAASASPSGSKHVK